MKVGCALVWLSAFGAAAVTAKAADDALRPSRPQPLFNGRDLTGFTLQTWGRLNWSGKSLAWEDRRGFRGPRDVEKPSGAWNRLECICREDRITVRLNGVTVNEAYAVYPRSGKILLQSEGAEIFFRGLALLPLSEETRRSDAAGAGESSPGH